MATLEFDEQDVVASLLGNIAEELPIIRPISEFIHLNLLFPYQHIQFWDALKIVSAKLEAMPFAEQEFYRSRIKTGDIAKDEILRRLEKRIGSQAAKALESFIEKDLEFIHHDQRTARLHELWNKTAGINIIQLADGMLIKWLSHYLDQGISLWPMPGSQEKGFYEAVRSLFTESYVLPSPFKKKNFSAMFLPDPDAAIRQHLQFLCPDKSFRKEYLQESLLTLRGWAGLIHALEKNRELLPFRRRVSLKEFIALKLTLERAWLLETDESISAPDFSNAPLKHKNILFEGHTFEIFRTLQELLEEKTYKDALREIKILRRDQSMPPDYQAVFCMDDRECSLRRHLEVVSNTQTFGTAGHFGIDCLYQHDEDAFPKKQCPAPVSPRYFISESKSGSKSKIKRFLDHSLIQPTHNLSDVLNSFTGAIKSSLIMTRNLFFPLAFRDLSNIKEENPSTTLKFMRAEEEQTVDGLRPGYTVDEMSDLIFQQLSLIGFVKGFAPFVFIIGHGSNSLNNPYFAAYGCGACSGRPGSANARTFVKMANHPDVRRKLKEKYSIDIPNETIFVAAFHDTCRDVVKFYDTKLIPGARRQSFDVFKRGLSEALYKNAEERSGSFKLVTYRPVRENAQKEVLRRSLSLFETRPELGHTNVAFAIVGRRELTKGLNLKRRSFLQSYDRTIDPTGEILAASLSAVVPVTSGISLDYYFSRVDNLRFGAGSKLPQNIVGNIGVSHGTESDLLCGLPFQMIDQHTPLRLFILVEQTPEIALKAIQDNKLVRDIIYNNWVHYGCWDEGMKTLYVFRNGGMKELNPQLDELC